MAAGLSAAAKTATKSVKAQAGSTVATVKAELKAESAGYLAGTLTASAALDQIVAMITAQRDALEDAALAATTQLSTDGNTLLTNASQTSPGRDFQAGGAGIWDHFLSGVDKLLDDTDAKLDAALLKTLKGMVKGAAGQGTDLDVRWRLPQHGAEYRAVAPPFLGPTAATAGGAFALAPAQILIATRFVDASTSDRLALGIRGGPASVAVAVSSTAGEQVALAPLTLGAGGTATGAYALTGLITGTTFVTLELAPDATHGPDARLTLSLPHTAPAPAGAQALLAQFQKNTQNGLIFFKATAAANSKAQSKLLKDNLKAIATDQSSPQSIAEFSFNNLRAIRNDLAFAFTTSTDSSAGPPSFALLSGGFTDAEMPVDFAVDAGGQYGDFARAWQKTLRSQQATATKLYDKFIDKVVKLSATHDQPIAVNRVLGQVRPLSFRMVTASASPPLDESVRPHITDGQILRRHPPGGADLVELHINVQSDPAVVPTITGSAVLIPDGTTTVISGIVTDIGGGASAKQALSPDLPLVGWAFRAGQDATKQIALIIVVTPQLITN